MEAPESTRASNLIQRSLWGSPIAISTLNVPMYPLAQSGRLDLCMESSTPLPLAQANYAFDFGGALAFVASQ
jgi:hypothetical protein